ncbi:MoaF C-terminal domain-containing protein [Nocardia sp. NPDC052112]|uniref:MoaF C-terminal domain-containing protein n=1 Tax=Nocardia sp. NPDC052112 TaxID=3155646 RepID=UPI00344A0439
MSVTSHTSGYRPPNDVSMAELFPNHDGLRPAAVDQLASRTIALHWTGGGISTLAFALDTVDIVTTTPGDWTFLDGTLEVEAFPVGQGLIGAVIADPRVQSSYFAVIGADHAVVVHTRMASGPTGAAEETRVLQAGVDRPAESELPLSSDLVGKRVYWRYSDTHTFEHLYLEPNRYCWHGLTGPEAGMGGVEPTSAYKIADNLYLFTWSDTSVAFNGTIVIDTTNDEITSKGRLFGWEAAENIGKQIIVGATGRVLNTTDHSDL